MSDAPNSDLFCASPPQFRKPPLSPPRGEGPGVRGRALSDMLPVARPSGWKASPFKVRYWLDDRRLVGFTDFCCSSLLVATCWNWALGRFGGGFLGRR